MKFLVAALLLLAPLTGCVGECGPTSSAAWTQPGLYNALASRAPTREPLPGLALDDAAPFAAYPNATVENVAWIVQADERGSVSAALYARPSTYATFILEPSAGDDAFRSFARAFFTNVSAAPEKWDGWIENLLAQRHSQAKATPPAPGEPQPAPGFQTQEVAVTGPFRIGALARELGMPTGPERGRSDQPGYAHVARGGWSITLQLPTRAWTTPEGVALVADPQDRASAMVEGYQTESLGKIVAATRTLGLSEPTLTSTDFHTLVC